MFPLRDLNPSRTTPWVTWSLILVCVLVFVFQVVQPDGAQQEILEQYALVPARVSRMFATGFDAQTVFSVFASMFMHGGLMHVAGNLWFLFIFGDNVEDNLGHGRYLAFYLLSGLAAAGMQWAVDPASTVPMVGASGAIAGVLAAYLVLYPRARVRTLIALIVFWDVMDLPSFVVITVWFVIQFWSGWKSLFVHTGGGVAYWAHIGGFAAGLLLTLLLRRKMVTARAAGQLENPRREIPRENPRPWDRSDGW